MVERYQRIIEALRRPEAYAHEAITLHGPIEVVETHVSHLFLTGEYVYKIKKPVDLGFIDLSTLEKRKANCERELALNRRLSPDVYLGLLTVNDDGDAIAVDGPGEVVDYVIKMRQLPRDRMLDALLTVGSVSQGDITRIARRIAEFHAIAQRSDDITRRGGRRGISRLVNENFEQTQGLVGRDLTRMQFDDIAAYNLAFLDVCDDLLREREEAGRIVDGHGDLHAAQICLEDDAIEFIDCIEFSEDYRYGDVALDLAFLAMDLDHYGRQDLEAALVDSYQEASGDHRVHEVLTFYKCYRAYVRGKVASIMLDTMELDEAGRASKSMLAKSYYELAHRYAIAELPERSVLVVMGPAGTGKSTLARALADHWGLPLVSSDVERKRLAGVGRGEHAYGGFGEGLYTPEMDRRTYDALLQRAYAELATGSVVLDATFRDPTLRQRLDDMSAEHGAPVRWIECTAAPDVVGRRIESRVAEGSDPSDATWEIYERQREGWTSAKDALVVDTDARPEQVLRRALKEIFAAALHGR